MLTPKSSIDSIRWPALPGAEAATMLAVMYQLRQSQWWTPEIIEEQQFKQLSILISHALQTVPFYIDRLAAIGITSKSEITHDLWAKIPILTRKDVQDAEKYLMSKRVPEAHGSIYDISTSGSTGRAINVKGTSITSFFWRCFTLREHYWHKRDFTGKLAVIRHSKNVDAVPPHGITAKGWGPATDIVHITGPATLLNISASIHEQVQWLKLQNADYLLTYPSNLVELLHYSKKSGVMLPKLKEVRTLGEIVTGEMRGLCQEIWSVPLVDMYSSQEAGYMALQCPENEHYHVQSENVLVEILDKHNHPCKPGQSGRVVITTLHNFATPLIRYETGDYAEVGEPCPCGRGLPVLNKIMGRQRNMLTLPSGEKRWPLMGEGMYAAIAPVEQYQIIQKSLDRIEVKLVVQRQPTEDEESALSKYILSKLGHPFELLFNYCDEIPRSAGGKFEDFRSEISE